MIKKLEHVAIIVKDMDESIRFYEDLFGFNVRLRGANAKREMAFIYLEKAPEVEIELIRDIAPMGEYAKVGIVNHLAFTVEDLELEIKGFEDKGVKFQTEKPRPTLDGGKMILFSGPSGELLQLVERGR